MESNALSNHYNLMIATTQKICNNNITQLYETDTIRCDATQSDAMNRQLNSNRTSVDSLLKQVMPVKRSKACTQKIHGISFFKVSHQ